MTMFAFTGRAATFAGNMIIAVDESGRLLSADFTQNGESLNLDSALIRRGYQQHYCPEAIVHVIEQLTLYSETPHQCFMLTLNPGGTRWQNRVWSALQKIPAGETRTYGEIAALLGKSGASRAVGRANATNPIALFIPCHRLVGADGALTGYAGGIDIKEKLLAHERGVSDYFSVAKI